MTRRDEGGVAARRAVARWSWRMFRREWRQQALVLVLITVAVALTVAAASAAYNMTASWEAEFGSASHRLVVDAADVDEAAVEVEAIEAWFGTTDQIRIGSVAVPGSLDDVEVRAQDPDGPLGASLLALRAGRFPVADQEIALTDEVADTFGAIVGSPVDLGGRRWEVTGLVENPEDLADEFALAAVTAPIPAETIDVLVDASDEEVRARPPSGSDAESFVASHGQGLGGRDTAVLTVYLVSTVVLILVALVAAAGFVAMAQRRRRQIGLLAATGATDRHLRLVMVANGAAVGAAAAVVGTVVGLLAWFAIAPLVEPVAERRIDRFDVPWWLVAVGMALAVATATGASWWPARAVSRLPVTAALSERPPPPRPARRSALSSGVLVTAGAGMIWWSDPNRTTTSPQPSKDLVMVAGVVAIVAGVLLLGPITLRLVGHAARRLPVTGRLALRDLARAQARSGMALGAVALALGIPVAVVITSAAARAGADAGTLSERDLLVRIGDAEGVMVADAGATDVEALAGPVERIAADLGGGAGEVTVVPLEMAIEPESEHIPGFGLRQAVAVGVPSGDDSLGDVVTYVATPAVVDHLGIDPDSLDGVDVLTVRTEPLQYISVTRRTDPETVDGRASLDVPAHSSGPTTLLTPETVRRRGWDTVPVGWLLSAPAPLTSEQVRVAREAAAEAGLTVESRRESSTTSLRMGAIGAGSALALAVMAMTVGLIRAETAGDLRTLAAVGATGTVRRRLTAWTAGALGVLGVALGGLGAYLALGSGYARELRVLADVPVGELAVIAVGVPLLAAAAGWALGGREPVSLVRPET